MVVQVHGSPAQPGDVEGAKAAQPREAVADEEGMESGVGSMERGERAKGHGCRREARRVQVDAEQVIDARQPGRRPLHAVDGGLEPVQLLVPRRRAGEHNLHRHPQDTHPPKRAGEVRRRAGGREQEQQRRADGRQAEVPYPVGEPCHHVEDRVGVLGYYVREIRPVEDVLEGRKHLHGDERSDVIWDEPG